MPVRMKTGVVNINPPIVIKNNWEYQIDELSLYLVDIQLKNNTIFAPFADRI